MIVSLTAYQLEWVTELLLNERDEAGDHADYDHRGSDSLLLKLQEAATPFTNATHTHRWLHVGSTVHPCLCGAAEDSKAGGAA